MKMIRKQRSLQDVLQGLEAKAELEAELLGLCSSAQEHTTVPHTGGPTACGSALPLLSHHKWKGPLMAPKPCKSAHLLMPFFFSLLALFILPITSSSLFLCSPWFMPQNAHLFSPPCILLLLSLWWILFTEVLNRIKDTLLFNFFILRKNSWS